MDSGRILGTGQEGDSPNESRTLLGNAPQGHLVRHLTWDPLDLAKSRIQAVITIRQLAQELEEKEGFFKDTLDPLLAKVVKAQADLVVEAPC